eukprot:scaffold2314_cov367-Prasinococcus_capsulatus_cf.AAC.1
MKSDPRIWGWARTRTPASSCPKPDQSDSTEDSISRGPAKTGEPGGGQGFTAHGRRHHHHHLNPIARLRGDEDGWEETIIASHGAAGKHRRRHPQRLSRAGQGQVREAGGVCVCDAACAAVARWTAPDRRLPFRGGKCRADQHSPIYLRTSTSAAAACWHSRKEELVPGIGPATLSQRTAARRAG